MECIEGVETFNYLGIILDQSDNDWLAFLRNFRKARKVWSRLGKLLWREGDEPRVSAMFYWAVVQVVLLFGAEIWVFSEADTRTEGGETEGWDLAAGDSR